MKAVTRVFLVGWMVLVYCPFFRYPPLDYGPAVVSVVIGFIAAARFLYGGRGKNITPGCFMTALLPWLCAGLSFANGALDHAQELHYSTVVVQTQYHRGIRDTLVVRSWRPGRTNESLPVSAFQRFFLPGERVTVGVKVGALGLPWISSISR